MPGTPFREVKRTIAREERVYECDSLAVTPRLAVVRYVFTRPLTAGGRTFEPGGWTEGFFWRSRPTTTSTTSSAARVSRSPTASTSSIACGSTRAESAMMTCSSTSGCIRMAPSASRTRTRSRKP